MLEKDELEDIMVGYFVYRMHRKYNLCHEVTCIALALIPRGFEPTEANIAQVDFYLQREHMYPEVYKARLYAVKILGNELDPMYNKLKSKEYQNKEVLEENFEDFEL